MLIVTFVHIHKTCSSQAWNMFDLILVISQWIEDTFIRSCCVACCMHMVA